MDAENTYIILCREDGLCEHIALTWAGTKETLSEAIVCEFDKAVKEESVQKAKFRTLANEYENGKFSAEQYGAKYRELCKGNGNVWIGDYPMDVSDLLMYYKTYGIEGFEIFTLNEFVNKLMNDRFVG